VLAGKISISPHLSERLLQSTTRGRRNPRANKLPMERLSDRELEVLEWLGQGLSVKTIAERLHRSSKTIETHRQRLKDKLHIKSNSELIAHAACWVKDSSGRIHGPRGHGRRIGPKSAEFPAG
jgi:DNA-binding NarL/FixJ family response regulator